MAKPRLLGWSIITILLIAAIPLSWAMAFNSTAVIAVFVIASAFGIRLSAPAGSIIKRLGWAFLVSFGVAVAATLIGTAINGLAEGGIVLALIAYGLYLGLPTAALAIALTFFSFDVGPR